MPRVRFLVFVGEGRRGEEEEAWGAWEGNLVERAWGVDDYEGKWVVRCRVGDV